MAWSTIVNSAIESCRKALSALLCEVQEPLGAYKSLPVDAGFMPDGIRKAISFEARKRHGSRGPAEASLRNEIKILMMLQQNAHIDKNSIGEDCIIEILPDRSFTDPSPCLTIELVEHYGSDLFAFLTSPKTSLNKEDLLPKVVAELCDALTHLQRCQVVHADLKCENVLLTTAGDIKVTDFGLSTVQGEPPIRHWPESANVPLHISKTLAPADFAQDLYGVGFIISQWCLHRPSARRSDITATEESLCKEDMSLIMTLGNLQRESWVVAATRNRRIPTCSTTTETSMNTSTATRGLSSCSTASSRGSEEAFTSTHTLSTQSSKEFSQA